MFKRGKSYIYGRVEILWDEEKGQYKAYVPNSKEVTVITGLTVFEVLREVDAIV